MGNTAASEIQKLPEILRPAATLFLEKLSDRQQVLPEVLLSQTLPVIACSEFAANVLSRDHSWFVENAASFSSVSDDGELAESVRKLVDEADDAAELKSRFRRFRHRWLLRVLWREVHQLADLDETLHQLSLLADVLLDGATRYSENLLESRFGRPISRQGEKIPIVILGMGKLGGRELNFSSDIDLIFCYSEDGETDGPRKLSAQEYFTRLSRQIIAILDEVTADGFVFRVDTRLRPFGESGPPVVSFAALEAYLLQHGRDWERYAYVKARVVGKSPARKVVDELYNDLIQPFVYRRYLDYGVFQSVREMQEMIAAEVRRRELVDNVKLGPGGIREAEFIVQALQLVRGGSEPELQSRELQTVLPRLVSDRGLGAADAEALRCAYRYLRRLENFIQAIRDQQTHDLPKNEVDRARICVAMGYADWADLIADLDKYRKTISRQFAAIAFRGTNDDAPEEQVFDRLWETEADERQWALALRPHTGEKAQRLAAKIVEFGSSTAVRQIDAVSKDRLRRFVPMLMHRITESSRPDRALSRTLAVTERILRRSAYLALLNENEQALSRLVDLCARSQYIAEQIARFPMLLDELLDPQFYSGQVSKQELYGDLQKRLQNPDALDSESCMQIIMHYQRSAMFRIAVADFNDRLPIMKVSDALTWLAEVVLEEALRVAWDDISVRHGVPCYRVDGVSHMAGFGIIGYGKLGGLEMSYGSDLDIVFLHDSKGEKQQTNGDKPLDNTMFFSRLVRRLVHLLTTQTGSGALYEVDTRLRPDGRSGLLVSSVEAFERYQEDNAWTWEHQALLRARAVAGSESIAGMFEHIRSETLIKRVRREKLRGDVIAMRQKMRAQLDRGDANTFDLKHGRGGIGDIEFLVQYLVLSEAENHAKVIEFSDNIRQLDALVAANVIDTEAGATLQEIYKSFRLRQHHLVLDGRKALSSAGRFVSEREFVAMTWDQWLA